MFQFPANPTLGQQFAPIVGVTYEWNGTGWLHLGMTTASLYPAGVILPYAGGAPLPFQGWLLCDGAAHSTANYPGLFAIIGYSYGGAGPSFNVPDLRGRVVAGVDGGTGRLPGGTMGAGLGAESVTLTSGHMPSHNHGISDAIHSHGVSDPTHAHGVYDPGHGHGVWISDPGHGHGVNDGGHQHDYQRARARDNQKPASSGTAPFDDYEMAQTDWRGSNISIAGAGTGISAGTHGAGTGIGIYGGGTGVAVQGNWSGINATHHAGSGAAHPNVQPTLCLNYIIKA